MIHASTRAASGDGWAEQNQFWADRNPRVARPYRATRERAPTPLVICGQGMSLRVERGALVVRSGFTHYPQVRDEQRLFPGEPSLPPSIIILDGSGTISFDVLTWLSDQRMPLTRIDWRGRAVSTMGASLSAYSPERVAWQVETAADPALRLKFCCALIAEKMRSSLHTLAHRLPASPERSAAIVTAQRVLEELGNERPDSVDEVLILEARAAGAYFKAWRGMPLKWSGLARRPIPNRWLNADVRNASNGAGRSGNRSANHPVNAILNYAYAVLYSSVQARLVAAGYDPARGVMHVDRSDASALVLDAMEPERAVVDAGVLKLLNSTVFSAADFAIRADGVCRLSPQLAKQVAVTVAGSPLTKLPKVLQAASSEDQHGSLRARKGSLPSSAKSPTSVSKVSGGW